MILAVVLVSTLFGVNAVFRRCWPWPASTSRLTRRIVGTALNLLGTRRRSTVIVKAINTAANPDDVSSIIQYGPAPRRHLPREHRRL